MSCCCLWITDDDGPTMAIIVVMVMNLVVYGGEPTSGMEKVVARIGKVLALC